MNTAYAVCGRERFGAAIPDMRCAVVSELTTKARKKKRMIVSNQSKREERTDTPKEAKRCLLKIHLVAVAVL